MLKTLTQAVGNSSLLKVLDEFRAGSRGELAADDAFTLSALETAVARFGSRAKGAGDEAVKVLAAHRIVATSTVVAPRLMFPLVTVTLTARKSLAAAAGVLIGLGYEFDAKICPAAWRAYGETYKEAVFLGSDGVLRLVVTWPQSRIVAFASKVRPNMKDLATPVPSGLWPMYLGLHVLRFAADRVKRRPRSLGLGPYLATPLPLIQPVLDLASPQEGELMVDLGCGDGRVLISAAQRYGCRGRGVEYIPELADRARANVAAAGLSDRIEIVVGDANDLAHVNGADVVFCFLPPESVNGLLTQTLQALPAGGRFVAHEQLTIDWIIPPSRSQLITAEAITVGHLWVSKG
jgi:SAM-dependent methyltransferase